jgi:hypothetical protein
MHSAYLYVAHSDFSLDLSDDDDDQGHLTDSPNHCDEQHDMQPLDAVSSAEEPIVALDAARFAVVEDLQCLLRSMQSAVDDQVLFAKQSEPFINVASLTSAPSVAPTFLMQSDTKFRENC